MAQQYQPAPTLVFNDLKELTDTRYPGIPSNAAPSTLGDALLLELTTGEYLFAKAIAGRNSLSWLQVNDNGSVTLYVSTLGKDYLKPEVPLLLIRQGKDIYSTIRQAYQALMKNTEAADLKAAQPRNISKLPLSRLVYMGTLS